MDEIWYHELGFHSNPFSIKPAAFTNEVVGHRLPRIFKIIDQGQLGYIVGPFGTGKTTLLKHVVGRYGGQGKVIYFSCGLERPMEVENLLRGTGSFFQKLSGSTPKDIIFLVDEASDIRSRDAKDLFSAYDAGNIKSILFVGTSIPRSLPPGMSSAIRENIVNISTLAPKDAIALVRNRVGRLPLLPDPVIKIVHKLSQGNTRLMLEYCEELCRNAISRHIPKITQELIDELFPLPRKKEKQTRSIKPRHDPRPLDQAIEEAVFEVEDNTPVIEGLSPIRENDPLPLYDSQIKKKRKKR